MSPAILSTAGAIWLFAHSFAAARECYAPDGTIADARFLPCMGFDSVNSMCCRLNDTNPDVCETNGLCYWPDRNTYYRNYCTDKNWNSPFCLSKSICDTASGGDSSLGFQVILCPGGSGNTFCCGESNSCCTEGKQFTLNPTLVSFTSNATANATTTTTVTATADAKTTSSDASSKNIAIGAGVGVPLGVLAIAMLGVGFWWGRRNTRAKYRELQQKDSNAAGIREADSNPVVELETKANAKGPYELSNSGDRI